MANPARGPAKDDPKNRTKHRRLDLVSDFPPDAHPYTSHLQNEAILNVPALALSGEAEQELADFLLLLQLAVSKYLGDEEEPKVSSQELAEQFGFDELRLRRVGAVHQIRGPHHRRWNILRDFLYVGVHDIRFRLHVCRCRHHRRLPRGQEPPKAKTARMESPSCGSIEQCTRASSRLVRSGQTASGRSRCGRAIVQRRALPSVHLRAI